MIPAFLHNQFLSGGLLLMVTGGAMALLRNIPNALWYKVKTQVMIQVGIPDRDPLFEWITYWLANHPYSKKARFLKATTKDSHSYLDTKTDEDSGEKKGKKLPTVIFTPADGEHFFRYKGKFIWLSRGEEKKGGSQPSSTTDLTSLIKDLRQHESYTFRTFGRRQQILRNLIDDVLEATEDERKEKVGVYTSSYGYWEKMFSYTTRTLESVILPSGVKEGIVSDLQKFLHDRDWYTHRGIPYRRGYLFYGPPGNGKTSLIAALAGELKLNLYSLNLSSSLGDSQLASLVRSVRLGSILLLEDVDAATKSRMEAPKSRKTPASEEKGERITLSGLLNVLDGILTPDGLVVIMTTNFPERLDPALVRPGRVDTKIEFTYATDEQKVKSFKWFYPVRPAEDADRFKGSLNGETSMATVQQRLIEMREELEN